MNIVILTTETSHHVYIVHELNKYYPVKHVMLETSTTKPNFETYHPYQKLQEDYEIRKFFPGHYPKMDEICETSTFDNINSDLAIAKLKSLNPDLIIVAGTGKLSPKFISYYPERIINLHGGDPQKYRGLDSILWSIYHHDYDSILITLHRLREELDTGEIIQQCKIELSKNMKLHELRAENVIICVKLLVNAINSINTFNQLLSFPQTSVGRYYSYMPFELKEICLRRFEKYTGTLNENR